MLALSSKPGKIQQSLATLYLGVVLLLTGFTHVLHAKESLAQDTPPKPQDFIAAENSMTQQFVAGDYPAAAETCLQAIALFRQLVPNDDGRMKGRATVFAPILAYGGEPEEALALAESYVESAEEKLGPQHFSSHDARMLRDIIKKVIELPKDDITRLADAERDSRRGEALLKQQDFINAAELLRQAMEVRKHLLGTANPLHVVDLLKLSLAQRLADEAAGKFDSEEPLDLVESAFFIIQELVPAPECPGGHPLVIQAGNSLAETAKRLGQYDRSQTTYAAILAIQRSRFPEAQHPKGHAEILAAMLGLAESLLRLEQYDAALRVIHEGLAMAKLLNPQGDINAATLHLYEAQIALSKANYGQARQSAIFAAGGLEDLEGEERTQENLFRYCMSLQVLAFAEHHQGNEEGAELFAHFWLQALEETFSVEKYPNGHFELAKGIASVGSVKSRLRKYEEAEQLFQRAITMYRKLREEPHAPARDISYAEGLGGLAMCKLRQKKMDEAIALFRQDIEILEGLDAQKASLKVEVELTRAHMHLGTALQYTREPVEVWLPHLEKAAGLARELFPVDKFPQGHPFLMISLRSLVRGKTIADEHHDGISLLVELIDLHYRYISHELMRANIGALQLELRMLKVELDWMLTYAYVLREQSPTYTDMAYRWIAAQKAIVLDTLIRVRQLERELKEDEELAELMEDVERRRASALELALNPPRDWSPQQLEEERLERTLRLEIEENMLMVAMAERTNTLPSGRISLDDIRSQLRKREGGVMIDIVQMNPLDLNADEVGNLRTVPSHYMAFVISPDAEEPLRLVDLGRTADIDPLIADLRKHIRDVPRSLRVSSEELLVETYKELAQPIYEAVVAPLSEWLKDVENVFIAPDGELNRIAFESLVDDEGRFLIENHTFAYLSSASDLLREDTKSGRGAVIFANPDYNLGMQARKNQLDQLRELEARSTKLAARAMPEELTRGLNWDPLPASAKEAELLGTLLKDSKYGELATFLDGQALEDYLKRLKQPRLVHLATHGFYLPQIEGAAGEIELTADEGSPMASQLLARLGRETNPLYRSGLVLAGANVISREDTIDTYGDPDDGWVTAEEVAMLDLRGTELVVLSACETGLADIRNGENVSGLRRAFIHAGARNLVTSLYKVPDEATQELMVQFYTNLRGQAPMVALHEAELSYLRSRRDSEGAAHPFFWGSFIFVGAPESGTQ